MNRRFDDRKGASNIQVASGHPFWVTVLAARTCIRYHAKEAGEEQSMSALFMRA